MQSYGQLTWSSYASYFVSITTSYQMEIYKKIAPLLTGKVVDFGCGAAKIGPYILEQDSVTSYTGIDTSEAMLEQARIFLDMQNCDKDFLFIASDISRFSPSKQFDSAISLNSYYTWENPVHCLKAIAKIIRPNGRFILITPNHNLDMPKLLRDVTKEVGAHPDFTRFCEINNHLVTNDDCKLISLGELVIQCHNYGFEVLESHQKYYDGGLNFLDLQLKEQ